MMQSQTKSEVARLKAEFELEYASAWAALHGPTQGNAQHKIITAKMERMSAIQDSLIAVMGEGRATRLVLELMEGPRQG